MIGESPERICDHLPSIPASGLNEKKTNAVMGETAEASGSRMGGNAMVFPGIVQ